MNKFNQCWYLIYTRQHHEKKVHKRFEELNIVSYLPLKKQLRTYSDRKKVVDDALFPSYIFIYLNNMSNYYSGMDTDGALYYVRSGKEIARVSESVINNIKLVMEKNGAPEVSEKGFQPGQRVVISSGALAGLTCEIVQCDNKQKLLVRVDLLQRNLLISIPEECLMVM